MNLTYQDMLKKMGLKDQKRDISVEEHIRTDYRR